MNALFFTDFINLEYWQKWIIIIYTRARPGAGFWPGMAFLAGAGGGILAGDFDHKFRQYLGQILVPSTNRYRRFLRFLIKIGALFKTKIPGRTPGKISNFGRGDDFGRGAGRVLIYTLQLINSEKPYTQITNIQIKILQYEKDL
jgi:hypothetical protein